MDKFWKKRVKLKFAKSPFIILDKELNWNSNELKMKDADILGNTENILGTQMKIQERLGHIIQTEETVQYLTEHLKELKTFLRDKSAAFDEKYTAHT